MVDLSIAMLVHQRVTIINQDQSALTYFDVWYPTMVPPSRGPSRLAHHEAVQTHVRAAVEVRTEPGKGWGDRGGLIYINIAID